MEIKSNNTGLRQLIETFPAYKSFDQLTKQEIKNLFVGLGLRDFDIYCGPKTFAAFDKMINREYNESI